MSSAVWVLLIVMFTFTASAALAWYWSKKSGYADPKVKYRMLQDDDEYQSS